MSYMQWCWNYKKDNEIMYKVINFNNKLIVVAFWQMTSYTALFKGSLEECEDYVDKNEI